MEEDLTLMNDLPGAPEMPRLESTTVGNYSNPAIGSAFENPVNRGGTASNLPVYIPSDPSTRGSAKPEFREQSLEDIMNGIDISGKGGLEYVSARELPGPGRYDKGVFVGRDAEEMYGQQQSTAEKWGNGVAKMIGTAGTTFVSGTVGVLNGIGAMIAENRLAAFYDNDVNRKMDELNKSMEDYLPNYYTQAESSAFWLSPKNVWTANFWSDKVIKNLGFSIGSMAGGAAWSKAFGLIGKINALVRAEKGLETLTAVETAMQAANSTSKFGAISKALNGISTKYINPLGSAILANGERTTISLMGSMGEASMEALQNMNDFRGKLIKKYVAEHGYEPSGAELDEINNMSDHVGNFTWGMNVALLSATNYIQLPKILSSSKTAEKRMMNAIGKEAIEEGATIAEKTASKYVASASNLEKAFGKPGKIFNNYLINPLTLMFAPMEAFEEGAQFAVQTGVEDYFNRAYENEKNTSDFWENTLESMQNVFTHGVTQALTTKEGLEGILIGGLSGGLQTSFSPFGENTLKERGFTGTGGVMGRNTQAAIDEINSSKNLTQALKDAKKFVSIGVNSQEKRQDAILNNDTFNEKNFEKDYSLSYIMPRVKYGKLSAINEELNLYRNQAMTPGGFEDLQAAEVVLENETRDQFVKRLDTIQRTAEQVNKTYELVNDRYSNIMGDDGKRLYSPDVVDKLVYSSAKSVDADERLVALNAELLSGDLSMTEFQDAIKKSKGWEGGNTRAIIKDEDVQKEITKLFGKVSVVDPTNQKGYREKIFDYANLLVDRKQFIDEYNAIIQAPQDHKDVEETVYPPMGNPKEVVRVKTKKGEIDVTVGEQYMLDRETLKSAKGFDVYEAPVITIQGRDKDGNFVVKNEDGTTITMTPDELENRKLSKVEDIKNNPKAAFYIANWNVIWKNRHQKVNGKPALGRLYYDKAGDRLLFVFKDEKGNIKEQELINTMFSYKTAAKLGFKQPYLTAESVLTPAQQQSLEAFSSAKTSFSEKVKARNSILSNLYTTSKERLEQVNKELTAAKAKVKKASDTIEAQANKAQSTRDGKWRVKTIKTVGKAISDLADIDQKLLQQVVALETEKEDLETTIPYFKDFLEDVASMPESGKEMIQGLKDDIKDLEDLIDYTKEEISKTKEAKNTTESLLKKALGVFNDYIKRLRQENPNIPLFIDDLLDRLERFMGPEGAQQFVAERLGYTQQVLDLESDIADFEDELNIPELKKDTVKLTEDLKELEKQLDSLIAQQSAKVKVLSEFQEYAARDKAAKEEEKRLHENQKLVDDLIGTLNQTTQNFFGNKAYEAEAKKPDMAVVTGTRPVKVGPYQARVDYFGSRMDNFKNRKNIKGIIVTEKTQDSVIPGLMDHLMANATPEEREKYPTSEIIALVMVEVDKKGNKYLVDQNGKRIPEGSDVLNSAIYQVFPGKQLVGQYYDSEGNKKFGSMFRETTPTPVKESLTKQYGEWVDKQLAMDNHDEAYDIDASFGHPDLVKTMGETKEEVDHTARTSAREAGLIDNKLLSTTPLISVKTNDAPITLGNVTFNSPKGRVFLTLPNGITKLFNRKFTFNEASVIYDVLLQISKNINSEEEITPETRKLFEWLRSTVYWGFAKDRDGKPKPAGYNNIWYEKVKEGNETKLKLMISGKTTDKTQAINFSPSELIARKGDILVLLQNLYNNTSNQLTNSTEKNAWKNPYAQIVGIKEDGTPETIIWPNYQSYLLSDKLPDAHGRLTIKRDNADIPLVTKFRPLMDENDTNRKGIYFTLKSGPLNYEVPKAVKEEAPKQETPKQAVTSTVQTQPAATTTPIVKVGDIDEKVFNEMSDSFNTKNGLSGASFPLSSKEYGTVRGFIVFKDGKLFKQTSTHTREDNETITHYSLEELTAEEQNNFLNYYKVFESYNSKLNKLDERVKAMVKSTGNTKTFVFHEAINTTESIDKIKAMGFTDEEITLMKELGFYGKNGYVEEFLNEMWTKYAYAKYSPNPDETTKNIEEFKKSKFYNIILREEAKVGIVEQPVVTAPVEPGVYTTPEGFTLDGKPYTMQLKSGTTEFSFDIDKYINGDEDALVVNAPDSTLQALVDSGKDPDKAAALERVQQTVAFRLTPYIEDLIAIREGNIPETKPQPAPEVSAKVESSAPEPVHYDLSGDDWNEIKMKYGTYLFRIDAEKYLAGDTSLKALAIEVDPEIVDAMIAASKDPAFNDTDVHATLYQFALAKVKDQLDAFAAQQDSEDPLANPAIEDATPEEVQEAEEVIHTVQEEIAEEQSFEEPTTAVQETEIANANDTTMEDVVSLGDGFFDINDTTLPNNEDEEYNYRMEVIESANKFEGENWKKVENWLTENFPNLPVYRVKNMIRASNGRYAWGALNDGAIYLYNNAEVGTVYHEVFEAVWKMFAGPKEKNDVIREFRNRSGYYKDRFTGKLIKYSKATNAELKEELAEEFRDKILFGKDPVRIKGKNLIARLFNELVDFIRTFFTGKEAINNTKQLFDKIGSGYYKTYNPYLTKLSFANAGIIDINDIDVGDSAELRINNIPSMQIHDIIQYMTYSALAPLSESNEVLFSLNNILSEGKSKTYNDLKLKVLGKIQSKARILAAQISDRKQKGQVASEGEQRMYDDTVALFNNIQQEWPNIVQKHVEHLKTFGLEFDENDELNINTGEQSGKEDYQDARLVDSFRKANSAVKLLLGTLPSKKMVDGVPKDILSSIGGPTLLPADAVHIDLMNRLHDAINVDEMLERLNNIAQKEPNYFQLFRRLTGKNPSPNINIYSDITESDYRLISSFFRTMKKQNADVITVFVQPTGEVIISDSTLSSATKEAKRGMMGNIIDIMKTEKTPYFSYEKKTGRYRATDTLKKVTFSSDMSSYTDFLKNLGVTINPNEVNATLTENQKKMFRSTVAHIKDTISKLGDKAKVTNDEGVETTLDTGILSISTSTLNIDSDMTRLGIIQAILSNPAYESTYFNINGQRTQSYVGPNAVSSFYDVISKIEHFTDDLQEPQNKGFRYLLTDKFSKNSQLLKKMFHQEDDGSFSDRIKGTEELLKTVFIDGTIDEYTGKKKESSALNYVQRFLQELNLNTEGIYLNLVPGDASIEHATRMHEQDDAFVTKSGYENDLHLSIFRDYFIDEVELARENRLIASAKGRNSKDLRFFKSILGEELHNKVLATVEDKSLTAEDIYDAHKADINKAVKEFIVNEAKDTRRLFDKFGILQKNDAGETVAPGLNFTEEELKPGFLEQKLEVISANYIIANIEYHKLIYSDPYQYKDELKRIKNFNSPRQCLIFNSQGLSAFLQSFYNTGVKSDDKIAYSDFERDYFRSITIADVLSTNSNIGYSDPYEETDGGGYITLQGARKFRLRIGDWTPANEKQFQFDIKYQKMVKAGAGKRALQEYLKDNPNVKSTYTPIKPIVSGNKENGRDYNDVVLHKFALVPLSFRVLHELESESNAIKLLDKMNKEDIDYAVYASGSKVGTEVVHSLYDSEGNFNNTPFESEAEKEDFLPNDVKRGVSNIPFSIVGLQTEVPSKDTALVTQGSQITKLVTMDFMEAGVPIDFMPEEEDYLKKFQIWTKLDEKGREQSEIYRLISHNQKLLEEKIIDGYETLLKKLGIKVGTEGNKQTFTITDKDKFIKTLKDEILKREVNDNIIDSFNGFVDGHVILEATPSYQQIRNILYSIADKNVTRPKISGGQKVQIPSTLLLEKQRVISETITDEKTGETKTVYASKELAFYENEDGKRVCEIMVGRWFKSDKTDEQLMDYFNNTDEGKKQLAALTGVAFRIPTQKQNSIDVFKIKKFLPKDFGDSVVVPSALVKKVGSDFDIDKLSIYLKNLHEDANGDMKVVPFYGYGKQAKEKIGQLYDKGEYLSPKDHRALNDALLLAAQGESEARIIEAIFGKIAVFSNEDIIEDFLVGLQEEKEFNVKERMVDLIYKQSLENEYIQSLENIISHPLNYDALVKPNSADDLKAITNDINKRKGIKPTDYTNVGNMLSRSFMSQQRHNFVTGKRAIGIAAVAQTNHSQNQRSPLFVDFRKLRREGMSYKDKVILGGEPGAMMYANNPRVNFKNYNSIMVDGVKYPTLSLIKAAGKVTEYISDTIGMFIDGYVDVSKGSWIMEMGANPNTAGTWLYLIKIGVPREDVAYFMNQPIITDYLQRIENKGQTWLFSERNIGDILDIYQPKQSMDEQKIKDLVDSIQDIPSLTTLQGNVGKKLEDMSTQEVLEQQFMLKEFVKYAKQASQLFEVTQGSNHDTANINDSFLVFKKSIQVDKARNTILSGLDEEGNTIAAVDAILQNSFVGVLREHINSFRNAFAEVLLSDKPTVRRVLEDVLRPYADLNDMDFVKVSQKAVNDLYDWAVQNNTRVNNRIVSTLLGNDTEKSAAKQIIDYRDSILGNPGKGIPSKPDHPLFNNIILKSVTLEEGNSTNKVDNLYLGKLNKVYDQNLIIYGFNELREYLKTEKSTLYGKMVRLALLQSGLTNSRISFTTLLPYKDFKAVYNATLSDLEEMENIQDFKNIDVYERNNWNNRDIISFVKGEMRISDSAFRPGTYDLNTAFLPKEAKTAYNKFQIPFNVELSINSPDTQNDFIVYSWESYLGKEARKIARKTGDRRHVNKYLMKKVYTVNEKGERVPYIRITEDKKVKGKFYHKFVYKAINPWGDSFKAQELYNVVQPSKLDNDFKKISKDFDATGRRINSPEVEDSVIVDLMEGKITAAQLIAVNRALDVEETGITSTDNNPVEPLADAGPKYYEGEITPAADTVFVFGSNPEGKHGLGAARDAVAKFGAKYYQGRGIQGGAYALVTKNLTKGFKEPKTGIVYDIAGKRSVRPDQITNNIVEMYAVARANPSKKFKIGYRNTISETHNGYTGYEMMDMFKAAGEVPDNVYFSKEWIDTGKMSADYVTMDSAIASRVNAPASLPGIDRTSEC